MSGTAIIDVGGGFRSIFGAGILDYCDEQGIAFDHCYGVSAGSANLASFLARQPGRTHRFYTQYAFRREYASAANFLKDRNFVNLDYVYSTLSNHDGEDPMDFDALKHNPSALTVVACNAQTGEAVYFDKSEITQDHYDIFKTSSAVPVACEPYVYNDVPYFDGGIADPVPVQKAIDDGYDRIVLVLTRLKDVLREQHKDILPSRILRRSYPQSADRLLNRYQTYNDEVALAKNYSEDGKVLILAPDDLCGLDTLSKSYEGLERMYRKGYSAASQIPSFFEQ